MSSSQKDCVCRKLRAYFEELRHIQCPGYYGSIGRRQLLNGMFWTGEGAYKNPAINCPFQSESALNEALVQKSKLIASENSRQGYKGDFYHRSLSSVFKGHRPVFTHGDFNGRTCLCAKSR